MTTVSGTGTISSAGIGSGLDVNSLVTQLVAAERAPQDTQLTKQTNTLNSQLAAYKAIQSALTNVQNALKGMQGTTSVFSQSTATSSDTTVFSASTSTGSAAGDYSVEVVSLATAQKLASSAFGSTISTVGTGRLTIGSGSNSFSLDIDATNNSVQAIRDAINGAPNNNSVTASLITADDGVHLVLSAKNTGTANAITVTASGGDGGLNSLVYDPANSNTQLSQLTKPTDAVVNIEGYKYTSSSNTVSGAIAGVTLNLKAAKPGTTLDLTVGHDTASVSKALQGFVTAYNQLHQLISAETAYDPTSNSASPLTGDSLARSVESQIRNALISVTPGTTSGVRSLFDIGLSTSDDGTLSLDSTKLAGALDANYSDVASLVSSTGPVGSNLLTALNGFVGDTGAFTSRMKSLNTRVSDVAKQRTALDDRMSALSARYTAQFSALDSLMAQMNATSSFLTNQFKNLSSNSNS
jgi:flagellar hook-associated protein 2